MANYHQLTLFDLEPYLSECNFSDIYVLPQVRIFSKKVEYEQLEIIFFPELSTKFSIKKLKRAA